MNCKDAYSMIHDFLDGALGVEEKKAFERHVAGCPQCTREVRAYRSLADQLGKLKLEDVPGGFAEPVIRFLAATGRIREPAVVGRVEQLSATLFGWFPARLKVPALAAVVLAIILSAISLASGRFQGFVGKSAVAATNAYIDVQQTVSSVEVLGSVSRGLEKDVRTAETVAGAVYLLLAVVRQTYAMPALVMLLMIMVGLGWYVRSIRRRSAQHASYCF